jgi:hypothetical protein
MCAHRTGFEFRTRETVPIAVSEKIILYTIGRRTTEWPLLTLGGLIQVRPDD